MLRPKIAPLDRKLLRDLWEMRGQAIAIALVVGSGVAIFVMYHSNFDSLRRTQATYYERQRFAEVFASLKRAPNRLEEGLRAIPGVARVATRVVAEVTVDVPGDPAVVRERATAAIAELGAPVEDPNAAGDACVWGIVPSGAMDMVPALVRIDVDAANSGGSRVHVRATGREGLIKQRIGAKAAERIAHAISPHAARSGDGG
jgi:hypothetical protein